MSHELDYDKATLGPCMEWQGPAYTHGYGCAIYGGKHWRPHRLAWTLQRGPIPTGMVVMHLCDNPLCVRIEHLRLGTIRENNLDARAKGRNIAPWEKGLDHAEIVRLLKSGMTQKAIAKQLGCSQNAINKHAHKAGIRRYESPRFLKRDYVITARNLKSYHDLIATMTSSNKLEWIKQNLRVENETEQLELLAK